MTTADVETPSGSKIEAFLSYAHKADELMGLAEPLRRDLITMIELKSGRDVEIFWDRDSLKWGERFRDSIENGLSGASVLFVIATTHYLGSASCRQEFQQFRSATEAQGSEQVRRLILPIMPIDAERIFYEDSDDKIASEIAAIQYEPIQEAVIEGPGSPAWKRAIIRLTDRFIEVVEAAEAEFENGISQQAKSPAPKSKPDAQPESTSSDDDDEGGGFYDSLSEVEDNTEIVTGEMNTLGQLIVDVGEIVSTTDFSKMRSAKEMTAKLALISKQLEPKTKELGSVGISIRDNVDNIDVAVRRLATLAKEDESGAFAGPVRDLLESMSSSLTEAEGVGEQMNSLLASMGPAEVSSAMLRKALKPMRTGVTAFGDAILVIQGWGPELLD